MGKIRTRTIGLEEEEKKQKQVQKEKSAEKKLKKAKTEKTVVADVQNKVPKSKPLVVISNARGKKYQEAKKLIDKSKLYSIEQAITLLKKVKLAKFDESVEIHLNIDETGLKGEVEFPHSTGKTVRVAILDDKILTEIESGKINFDVLITHPSFMPRLAKFAKVLGPKGLMPNPKAGTISTKPEEVAKKFAKGVTRWKTEAKFPLIHQMVGKISFVEKDLSDNVKAFIKTVGKGHIQKAVIKSTMSPGIKLDVEKI